MPAKSKSALWRPADRDTSVRPFTIQYSASAPYILSPSKKASLASTSKLGVKPYPSRVAIPHSLSASSSPRSTVGNPEILKLPSLMVSAEFIRKFWAPAVPVARVNRATAGIRCFMLRDSFMGARFGVFAITALAALPAFGQDRTRQYLGLAKATLEQPITPAELEAAVLSPAGVAAIAGLFERAVAASIVVGGASVTPELGGEATLERGQLRFVSYPDPLHPIIRRMLDLRADPKALLDMLTGSVEGQQI